MVKISWRSEAVSLLLLVAMFVAAAVTWPVAPDRIPMHWGMSGEVDSYGGRFEGLLLLPVVTLGLYVLFLVLPRIDPRKEHYARFQGAWTVIRTMIVALMAGTFAVVVLWARGVHVNTGMVVFLMVGLLLMVLGNYLGKVRSNWFVGIKTPWTLSSEESWNKTHRLGGKLFFLLGLALAISAPFEQGKWAGFVMMPGVVVLTFVLCLYSYLVWRKDPAANHAKNAKQE